LSSSSRFQTAILHKCSTNSDHDSKPPSSAAVTDPQPRCYPCRCNAKAAVTDTKRLKETSISLPDQWALEN
jgi:hypothetical protein